ncbi:MAG: peptidoglycan-binding protein [Kovacikia sp.]
MNFPWRRKQRNRTGEGFCLFTRHPILHKDFTKDSLQEALDKLQTLLQNQGLLDSSSGKFDDATKLAVKAFQTKNNLHPDGVVGPLTWACLLYPTLSHRDRNPSDKAKAAIKDLQDELRKEKKFQVKISDSDGVFGKSTETAVRRFQSTYGLIPDGIVGAWTWTILKGVRHTNEPPRGIFYPLRQHLYLWEQAVIAACVIAGIFWNKDLLILSCILAGIYYSPLNNRQSPFPVSLATAIALSCVTPFLVKVLGLNQSILLSLPLLQYAPYVLTGIFWSPLLNSLKRLIAK